MKERKWICNESEGNGVRTLLGVLAYSALYLGKGLQKLAIEGIKAETIRSQHSGTNG